MAPILYMVPPSPAVRAVLITAKAIGLDLVLKEVDMAAGEHLKPEFKQINPQHTIPTLVDDDGFAVWDSHAIITYLVSKYAQNDNLYPQDIKKRATIDQRLYFELGVVFPLLFKIADPIIRGEKNTLTQEDKEGVYKIYEFLEAFLDGRKWIANDCVSVADYSLVSSVGSLHVLVPVESEKYPRVGVWLKNCESLSEYEANKTGLDCFTNALKNKLA